MDEVTTITTINLSMPYLHDAIRDTCDERWNAGYKLASMIQIGQSIMLVFQPKERE